MTNSYRMEGNHGRRGIADTNRGRKKGKWKRMGVKHDLLYSFLPSLGSSSSAQNVDNVEPKITDFLFFHFFAVII